MFSSPQAGARINVKERGAIWNKYTDGVISRVQTMRLDPNNKKQRHAPNPLKIFFCRIEYDAVEQACLLHRSICRQSPRIIMRAVNRRIAAVVMAIHRIGARAACLNLKDEGTATTPETQIARKHSRRPHRQEFPRIPSAPRRPEEPQVYI